MNTPESPTDIMRKAENWFTSQVARIRAAHKSEWENHREWVLAYLREEVRLRLIARGWRADHE